MQGIILSNRKNGSEDGACGAVMFACGK